MLYYGNSFRCHNKVRIPKSNRLLSIVERYGVLLDVDKAMARKRADELSVWGFDPADAAHVAFAEAGNAKFITCDDKLLKKCAKYAIRIWYGSPVLFCTEEDLR
jgi:predicted nucleic acid-binding protein